MKDFIGKKVAILGFGREGKSSLRFLLGNGIEDITILDKNEIVEKKPGIKYISGENYLDFLGKFDIIIKSPGISPYNSKISPFLDKITSQTQIFFDNYEGKVIGITATKGKSTTSTLAYLSLKEAGFNVRLVGNIGNPVLDEIDLNSPYDYVVYELSSYMLDGLRKKNFISILGNIYPDHLDYHDGFENYRNAKLNILAGSKKNIIRDDLGIENGIYFGYEKGYSVSDLKIIKNDKILLKNDEILLKGEHNLLNIASIFTLFDEIGVDICYAKEVLKTFKGLPHRMEFVGEFEGIKFVDDAISTTPESTIEAIKTYGDNIGIIFLGGQDRGYNFDGLVKYLDQFKIENVVLFPETGEKIEKLLCDNVNLLYTRSMKDAVKFAFENCPKGKIVLLSSASPSYNLWRNYEEKGNQFYEEIKSYIKK